MSKKTWYMVGGGLIIAVFLFLWYWPFGQSSMDTEETKPKVAATIFPVYDLVRVVAGSDIEVELILPPGASPHYFEPTPSRIRSLQGTKTIFIVGVGLDMWAESVAATLQGAAMVPLSKNINLRESMDEHEEGARDPHYWLSPANSLAMIDTIAEALSNLHPDHALDFQNRATNLKDDIQEKNTEWQKAFVAVSTKEIITFHDAFFYFADHFGLEVLATFEPFPGKEPTPQYLAELSQLVKIHPAVPLFLEPQLSDASIQAFAKDTGVSLSVLDPTGGVPGRESYIDLIDFNVNQIVQSLSHE